VTENKSFEVLPTYDVGLLPIETMLYVLFTENVTERLKPTFVRTLALWHVISFSSIGVTYHTQQAGYCLRLTSSSCSTTQRLHCKWFLIRYN